VAGSCTRGTEPLDSIKGGQFIEQMSDYQHLKEDSTSRSYVK
jgi:hypothetical protein